MPITKSTNGSFLSIDCQPIILFCSTIIFLKPRRDGICSYSLHLSLTSDLTINTFGHQMSDGALLFSNLLQLWPGAMIETISHNGVMG